MNARFGILAAANLLLAGSQALAPSLSRLTGFGVPIEAQGGNDPPIVPADYAFVIWAFVFPACIAYGVFQALPAQRANGLLRRVRPPAAVAFGATTLWSVCAQAEWVAATVACMVVILGALAWASVRIADHGAPLTRAERLLVRVPLNVFFGWITLATVANTASALAAFGVRDPWMPDAAWAALLAGVTGVIAAALARRSGGLSYVATVAWGLAGIMAANLTRFHNPEVVLAAAAAALFVCLALVRVPPFARAEGRAA